MGMNTFISGTADRSRPYRVVGVAAVLVAAVAIGVMFAVNANRPQPAGALTVKAAVNPSALAPSPASNAVTSAAVAPVSAAGGTFVCGSSTLTAQKSPATAFVDAIRPGTHKGYDRVVVEFKNGQPGSIEIRPQAGTTFNQSPSGRPVTLAGRHGILVIIRGADAHTAYSGQTDFVTGYSVMVEVRQVQDFEGVVQYGIGLSQAACYHAFILTNPTRLVIDVQVG